MTAPPDQIFAEAVRSAGLPALVYAETYVAPRYRPMDLAPRRKLALARAREQLAFWRAEGLSARQICHAVRRGYRKGMGDGELVSLLANALLPVMRT